MDIGSIGKIRIVCRDIADGTCRWPQLEHVTGEPLWKVERLLQQSGIIDMAGELLEGIDAADILFVVCLYYSMRASVKFTQLVY